MYTTDQYEGMLAETVNIQGANGDTINAYYARPLGPGPFPGIVLIHHLPRWDELYREFTRKMAHPGYLSISPNLYSRNGHGTPEDAAAKVRSGGGVPDDQMVGDVQGSLNFLKAQTNCTGKVGVWGTCSGGRHTVICASKIDGFSAAADLWGGRVVMAPDTLNEKNPVAPIDMTPDLKVPLFGLFGEDDQAPTPAEVAQHEEALKAAGKDYEFHMYPGAGHGFFYYDRAAYRQEQAVDGWNKMFAFFSKHLSS